MSEKVTFRELIESIAEESDNSKQFTHDFLKDFVDVINGGLEQDGNVNIAGFGKFKLRHVDEREGYNPQTEEKMTIPAHNKLIFKPYKDVRELVNAPYAHLEPELIEEDADDQKDADQTSSTEENAPQDDFLPTAPPTEHEEKSDSPKEKHEDPFGFDNAASKSGSSFSLDDDSASAESPKEEDEEDEDDIVEFRGEASDEEEAAADQELSEFIGEAESSEDETETEDEQTTSDSDTEPETSEEEEASSPDDEQEESVSPFAPNAQQEKDSSTEDQTEEKSTTSKASTFNQDPFDQNLPRRNRNSSLPLIATAAGILLLLIAGAWYFGFFASSESPQMTSQQKVASSEAPQQAKNQQQNSATHINNGQQQSSQQTNQQATPQSQQQQANSKTTTDQSDTEEHAIAKGQTLWSIAEDKYGNPRLWPWIYGKNGSLADPDIIITGESLDVPLPSGPQNRLNEADSVGVAKGYLATYQWYKDNGSSKAKNHLWGAKLYHNNIRDLADNQIDKADLSYVKNAR